MSHSPALDHEREGDDVAERLPGVVRARRDRRHGRRTSRGFTLLDFGVFIVAMGTVGGFLVDQIVPLAGRLEKVAFEETWSRINGALRLEAAARIMRGDGQTLPALASVNPMTLLAEPPGNYVGSFKWAEPSALPRSVWYFDEHEGLLVYRPGRQADFRTRGGPHDRIELTVRFAYRNRGADDTFDPSVDEFEELSLVPLNPYAWSK